MPRFLARAALSLLKAFFLVFVGIMGLIQIPELRYDLGPKSPVAIETVEDLLDGGFRRSTFVAVRGIPDFERAFSYPRYGLNHSYFNVQPYGLHLVVRTYDQITDEWEDLDRFLGRLRPFDQQPFSYRIEEIYRDRMGVEIPEDAYFLALDDVPRPSGWQVGAVIFAGILWCGLLYFFFLRRRPRS